MTKLISAIIFIFLTFNIGFSQNKYIPIEKDLSSFFYYYNYLEISKRNFEINTINSNIDYSSYIFMNFEYGESSIIEVWANNKIYVNKLGGVKHLNEVITTIETKHESSKFPQWIIIVFIIIFTIIAWTNYFYSKYLVGLFKSYFNYRAAQKLFNESNILTGRSAFALTINFFLIISLNIFLLLQLYSNFDVNELLLFFIIFLISIIIFAIKNTIITSFGNILNNKKLAQFYNYNIGLYNQVIGIICIPLLLLISYVDFRNNELLIYINLGILLLIYLTRIIRSIKIFLHEHFSILYLFLYLCAIEFLPVYIIFRLYNNVLL